MAENRFEYDVTIHYNFTGSPSREFNLSGIRFKNPINEGDEIKVYDKTYGQIIPLGKVTSIEHVGGSDAHQVSTLETQLTEESNRLGESLRAFSIRNNRDKKSSERE